jgi:hypothetical protein
VRDGRDAILLPFAGLSTITRCSTYACAAYLLGAIDQPEAEGRVFNCADRDQYTLSQWVRLMLDALGSDARIVGLPEHLNWGAAHMVPLGGTTSPHAMVDASAIRAIVDDSSVPSGREALARTMAWRLAQPAPEETRAWEDPFDYALEDELIARLDAFEADLRPIRQTPQAVHPYPHPRKPGLTVDERGR